MDRQIERDKLPRFEIEILYLWYLDPEASCSRYYFFNPGKFSGTPRLGHLEFFEEVTTSIHSSIAAFSFFKIRVLTLPRCLRTWVSCWLVSKRIPAFSNWRTGWVLPIPKRSF